MSDLEIFCPHFDGSGLFDVFATYTKSLEALLSCEIEINARRISTIGVRIFGLCAKNNISPVAAAIRPFLKSWKDTIRTGAKKMGAPNNPY